MSALFSSLEVGGMSVPNRIVVAPMCQYSADDGSATDWHLQHWMSLAMSGAGAITIEATAVERRGRITHGCLGLYSDDNEAAAARTLAAARRVAPAGTRFGIQIAHAGRKASTRLPWAGGEALSADEDPWTTDAPSALPFGHWHVPHALDAHGIERIIGSFVAAARRAVRAGFDYVELHGAHGYLIHEFLSPLSNTRTDQWGGPLHNRMRLFLEIVRRVRAELPPAIPLGARLSVTDWVAGGFDIDEAVAVVKAIKAEGVAFVCVSSSGLSPEAKPPLGPGYMVPFAARIRRETGIATRAVGMIDRPAQAEAIVANGEADLVALARAILADPRWPWRAAVALGAPLRPVAQYARSAPLVERWAKENQSVALAPV